MNKIKYCLFAFFLVFSFYFTDQILLYIDNQSPLMQTINNVEDYYNVKAVDAIIKDNTIIPGIKGKSINKHKSLLKMEEFGSFNELYLVYDYIAPDISIINNKDKIIIKGNDRKREVALILEENKELENYLKNTNINYNILCYINTNLKEEREYINAENNYQEFSDLNTILNKKSLNKNICFLDYSNLAYCQNHSYYLVSHTLSTNNKTEALHKLNSGDIILINKNTSLETLKLVLNEIQKLDLKIVYLSKLISE